MTILDKSVAMEAGVQLHTHFLAHSLAKKPSLVYKNSDLLNKLHTHIFMASDAPVNYWKRTENWVLFYKTRKLRTLCVNPLQKYL